VLIYNQNTSVTLVENFKCPVILFDYPANIKAFYMRLNDNTEPGETVRAMDIIP
jgi:asparaginyl-tRNA synthetase